jgi:hypothetical protein
MKNDPGLFTDSTGEGMAGAEDVALSTQKDLNSTQYNGDNACTKCGMRIDPVQSLLNQKVCPSCLRKAQYSRVKGRMV